MGKLLLLNKASPWSHDKNNIDQMVFARLNNDKGTIKVAKQVWFSSVINSIVTRFFIIQTDTSHDDDG